MKDKILPFLSEHAFVYFLRILKATMKIEVIGHDYSRDVINRGEGHIPIFWHGQMMILMMHHSDMGYYVMVSSSKDGEIIARILTGFGFNLIRGSSKRGGKDVLLKAVSLLKENKNVAITPDGPTGPYRKVKIGTILAAQKSGRPIVPFYVYTSHKKVLKSWDRFNIAMPFSKCFISYGKPV